MRSPAGLGRMPDLSVIIFSKDRPCQLDLLLGSIEQHISRDRRMRWSIIYRSSHPNYRQGYALVQQDYPWARWVPESDFRTDVLEIASQPTTGLMFLVDDDVVLAPFSLDQAAVRVFVTDDSLACLSLRMHPNVSWCHPKQIATPPPDLQPGLRWQWQGLLGDWGYPMSLDGHLFRSADIVPLLARLPFHNPNSLESALAGAPIPKPWMACYPQPRLVNIPCNRVQQTALNRHMGHDPEELNRRFLAGERLDRSAMVRAHRGTGPHEEIEPVFSKRILQQHHPAEPVMTLGS